MQALDTHDVFNQFDELTDINLLQADTALQEVLQRQQAQGFVPALSRFAQQLGEKHNWEHAELANRHTPELQRFDARGRVLDAVEFHPSWHRLMELYREQGLISLPFESRAAVAGAPGPPAFTCTARWSKARYARPP
jgi:putative acyl-CoA dehydrogenase